MSDNPLVNLDECQKKALEIVKNEPHRNLFIQGQAGTGKSTLIKFIKEELENQKKLYAVVAPSGIAAELIGGTTIHSLFKLGAHDYFPLNIVEKYQQYQDIVKHIDTLIIDEVSMLRADVFDTIDMLCQKAKNNGAPFGAIRVILVGDLFQLPPVYKHEKPEESIPYMKNTYGNKRPFFFDAHCYAHGNFGFIELTTVHRQNGDDEFIDHLRVISQRQNLNLNETLAYFNQRVTHIPHDDIPIITARNNLADEINNQKLAEIQGKIKEYAAKTHGSYYEGKEGQKHIEDFHIPALLTLKKGARVMICKNGPPGYYVNGTLGTIHLLGDDSIVVKLVTGLYVTIKREEWKVKEYFLNEENKLDLRTIGSFKQFPLKLAYAMTIHKSQGQTWENVYVNLEGGRAFAPGQVYVALSRVKSISGVHLNRELTEYDILVNGGVKSFLQRNGIVPPRLREESMEISDNDTREPENKPNHDYSIDDVFYTIRMAQASLHESQISRRYNTAAWTIKNEELNNDIYLQAGRKENDDKVYIFKIKGKSYKKESFAPNDEKTHFCNPHSLVDENRRDISVRISDFIETFKGSVNFAKHLWVTLDYKNNSVIINNNYDERDNNSSIIQAPIATKKAAIEQSIEERQQPARLEIIVNWIKKSGAYYHYSSISPWEKYKQVSRWTIRNQELEFDLYLQAGNDSDGIVYIFKIKEETYKAEDFFEHNPNRYNDNHPNIPNLNKRDIWIKLDNGAPREILKWELFKKHLWVTINCKTGEAFRNPNYDKNDDDAYTQVPF